MSVEENAKNTSNNNEAQTSLKKPELVSKNKIINENFVNQRPTPGFIISPINLSRIKKLLNKTKIPGS